MIGTNYSTGGLRRITRLAPVLNVRLVVFAVAVSLGVLLILWLQAGVGRQLAHLEAEFAALKAEGFYVGVQARVRVRRLNELLLGFNLDQTPADVESFRKETADLKSWLSDKDVNLSTTTERELFDQLETACDRYLADAERLLQSGDPRTERATFAATYEKIQQQSQPLLDLVGQFMAAQQTAFNSFLQASQETLLSLRLLLNLSLGLLLVAGVALAGLTYRGMIAPLRRRLTESQAIILRQEKLASLGTLAAGVAHEIRNPLTAIKLRLFSLNKSLPPEFSGNQDAAVISEEINRLERIVKDFLQFARPSEPESVRVPAERIVQEVHALLKAPLEKSAIQLCLETPGNTWVHADTQQIKQALINLVQNAADSVGRNGTISLRVRQETTPLNGRSRATAVLQVVDTGKGIPAEVQERLFDPFFSTKDRGTGLGLAISARIVEKHGGLLRFETELHRGTTFEIVLPRIEDHAT